MQALAVVCLFMVAIAGCLGAPTAAPAAGPDDPSGLGGNGSDPQPDADRRSREGGDSPDDSFELVSTAAPGDLTDVLELHWAYDTRAGHQAIELVLDFGKDNDCKVQYGQQTNHIQTGPNNLMLGEFEGRGLSWGTGSSGGGLATVHAAGVDTRTGGGGGGTGHLAGVEGPMSGTLRVTFVSVNWEGWGDSASSIAFLPGDVMAALSATCKQPFSLASARIGASVLLADASNLAGGTGVEVGLVGAANLQDSLAAELPSPVVRATCDGFGVHAGRSTLDAPSGQTSWTFLPDLAVSLSGQQPLVEDGPGTYVFSADRAGAYFEAFWCGAWGLDGAYDPVPDLVGSTVIDSPFD